MKKTLFAFIGIMTVSIVSLYSQVCVHGGMHVMRPSPPTLDEVLKVQIPPPTEREIIQRKTEEISTTYLLDGVLTDKFIIDDKLILIFKDGRYNYSVVTIQYSSNKPTIDIKNFIKALPEEIVKPAKPLEKE